MNANLTGNIAIGVGAGNLQRAADFYEHVLGLKRGQTSENWIEMQSGPLTLYLVGDEQNTPTFELLVENVDQAMEKFLGEGNEEVNARASPNERYIKTPFGQYFCISPRQAPEI